MSRYAPNTKTQQTVNFTTNCKLRRHVTFQGIYTCTQTEQDLWPVNFCYWYNRRKATANHRFILLLFILLCFILFYCILFSPLFSLMATIFLIKVQFSSVQWRKLVTHSEHECTYLSNEYWYTKFLKKHRKIYKKQLSLETMGLIFNAS